MYSKVEKNMSFVEREKQTEKFWKDHDIFRKSMENRKEGEIYTFYAFCQQEALIQTSLAVSNTSGRYWRLNVI